MDPVIDIAISVLSAAQERALSVILIVVLVAALIIAMVAVAIVLCNSPEVHDRDKKN